MQRKFFLTLTIILSAMVFSITAAAQQKFTVNADWSVVVNVRSDYI